MLKSPYVKVTCLVDKKWLSSLILQKKFGKIDIAINTIGKMLQKPIIETSKTEFDAMITVN